MFVEKKVIWWILRDKFWSLCEKEELNSIVVWISSNFDGQKI